MMKDQGPKAIDGYEQFFEILPKEKFISFGLENVITVAKDAAAASWAELIRKVDQKDSKLGTKRKVMRLVNSRRSSKE